jgi:Na+/melibiose symporter-like transporter
MVGNVVGLMVAGFIVNIRYVGAIGGFYIDSATFFFSAALIAMIALKEREPHNVREDLETTAHALESSLKRSVFSEIKEGLGYLTKYSDMRFIMKVFFLLLAGLGAISCVIIVFIQNAFGTSTRHIGFFGTYLVCGLLLGTVLYGRFGQKLEKKRTVYMSFAASGIFIILFAILVGRYPNVYLAGILSGLIGLAVSPMMASLNTLTNETIPEEVRGRIFSSLEEVIHLAFLVFMFVAAYAAKFIDRFWILVAAGTVFSLCGIAGIISALKGKEATCP